MYEELETSFENHWASNMELEIIVMGYPWCSSSYFYLQKKKKSYYLSADSTEIPRWTINRSYYSRETKKIKSRILFELHVLNDRG